MYLYANASPLANIDPSGLWGFDAHGYRTCKLPFDAKLSSPPGARDPMCEWGTREESLRLIGRADRHIDRLSTLGQSHHFSYWDDGWSQYLTIAHYPRYDRQDHFKHYAETAETIAGEGRCCLALATLGEALHPLQDQYSHGLATPCEHTHQPQQDPIDDRHVEIYWQQSTKVKWNAPGGVAALMWVMCRYRTVREFARSQVLEDSSQEDGTRMKWAMWWTAAILDAWNKFALRCQWRIDPPWVDPTKDDTRREAAITADCDTGTRNGPLPYGY
jgi:hypothetical protein